jgi:uncharacterized protein YgiM (DUF1202 family)
MGSNGAVDLAPWLPDEALPRTLSLTEVLALPQASAGDASTYGANMQLFFKKTSSYKYPSTCLDGQVVTYLQTNSGIPPAQVKWSNGHTYWVEWADLRVLAQVGSNRGVFDHLSSNLSPND